MSHISPVAAVLQKLEEAQPVYFLPKEVRDWFSNRDEGPVALIHPWKTKRDIGWWVFTCPPGEADILKQTLGLNITHLFVSDKWYNSSFTRDRLFNYKIGQFEARSGEDCRWRIANPEKAERDIFELTPWKMGRLRVNNTTKDQRRTSGWYS